MISRSFMPIDFIRITLLKAYGFLSINLSYVIYYTSVLSFLITVLYMAVVTAL